MQSREYERVACGLSRDSTESGPSRVYCSRSARVGGCAAVDARKHERQVARREERSIAENRRGPRHLANVLGVPINTPLEPEPTTKNPLSTRLSLISIATSKPPLRSSIKGPRASVDSPLAESRLRRQTQPPIARSTAAVLECCLAFLQDGLSLGSTEGAIEGSE